MPGIVVFNRRWVVGSDDFVIPFGIGFVLRGIWMLSLGIVLALFHSFDYGNDIDPRTITCQATFDYFTSGYIVLLFATNLLEFLISWISSRGTIMDDSQRQVIPTVLYIRLCFCFAEIFWLSLGLKWVFIEGDDCELTPGWKISKGVVIFNWMFVIFVGLLVFCSFDSAGKDWVRMVKHAQSDKYESYRSQITNRYTTRWEDCFQCCCVCSGVEKNIHDQNIYSFIGMTLSEFFQDLDVVPSDLAAGLMLLRKLQKREENRQIFLDLALTVPPATGVEFSAQTLPTEYREMHLVWVLCQEVHFNRGLVVWFPKNRVKKMVVTHSFQRTRTAKRFEYEKQDEYHLFQDVVHYAHYAVAAYGWPVYFLTDKCACCSMMDTVRCCYECRAHEAHFGPVLDDNCCKCNFSAIKQTLGDFFHNVDMIYTSFVDSLYVSPFYVAVDHDKKSVIVSIRGTLSLQNILTDFNVDPERIPCSRGAVTTEWFAHKGMLKTALSVKEVLENKGILTEAFNRCPVNERHKYQLVVVGHSLGAGAAAVLAILLRDKYPNLFSFAYSPPGATLSYDATKYAEDFILSVVIGKDMISRLSLNNLKALRDKVMFIIPRTRMPKWKILRSCVCPTRLCCCRPKPTKVDKYSGADIERIEKDFQQFSRQSSTTPDFYPPGRVLHLAKTKTNSTTGPWSSKRKVFEPFWSSSEDFNEILISNLMWADHMPDFVLKVLKDTFSSWSTDDESYYSVCKTHDHELKPTMEQTSESGSRSVLDSPTGAIIHQPGAVDLAYV